MYLTTLVDRKRISQVYKQVYIVHFLVVDLYRLCVCDLWVTARATPWGKDRGRDVRQVRAGQSGPVSPLEGEVVRGSRRPPGRCSESACEALSGPARPSAVGAIRAFPALARVGLVRRRSSG